MAGRLAVLRDGDPAADGSRDASPKGDPAGQLVHVIDDRTIALAERPGNKRADGYKNIIENPHVGLVFLIPGRGDTLRINGRARLVRDAPFFDEMVVKGHRPLLAVVVEIDEIFLHCGRRSCARAVGAGDLGPGGHRAAACGHRHRLEPRQDHRGARRLLRPDDYNKGYVPDYPFLKGHGTENDFVMVPDHEAVAT